MKILFTSCRYYPVLGGAELAFMNLIHEVSKKHEVLILTQESSAIEDKNMFEWKDKYGNPVKRLEYRFDGPEFKDPEIDSVLYKEILEYVKEFKPDLIHSNFANHFSYVASLVAKDLNIPFVQTVCGSDVYLFPELNPASKIINKALFRNSDRIIGQSKDILQKLKYKYSISNSKLKLILNGIVSQDNVCEVEEDYIITIGNVSWVKGYDMLCGIASLLKKINSNIKIKVVGSINDRSWIEKFQHINNLDNIDFVGKKDREETDLLTKKSLFMVSTSHYEGFSLVILEAYACGKPVIGFDTYGVRNIIEHNKTGLLVEYMDLKGFAESINELYVNKDLRNKLGRNAYKKSQSSKYKWSQIAKETEKIYLTLLSQKKCTIY